nr:hypothetical protein [Tanacetum cinerariifolium]
IEVVTIAKLITEVVTAAATQVGAASTPILAAKPKDDDVFVEAIPLAPKVPVMDYQVVVIDNKP